MSVRLNANRDDYLMIAVHGFQFHNKTWSHFSECHLLMDAAHNMKFEENLNSY